MKLNVALVLAVVWLTVGCEDTTEYPDTPQIELKELRLGVSPIIWEPDSLVVTISFKDGNGDLGLENYNYYQKNYLAHTSDPYHPVNYFLADEGNLTPVPTFTAYTDEDPPRYFTSVLYLQPTHKGKLVTEITRDDPAYSYLPSNTFPDKCFHYVNDTIYVVGEAKRILSEYYKEGYQLDTLYEFRDVYSLKGSFYVEHNPNYYNITVDYLVKQPDGSFLKFDWETVNPNNGCGASFNGRFPMIRNSRGVVKREPFIITQESKFEGTIEYGMKSSGFQILFGDKTLKLQISIKDRALNSSNVIETEEFTLESILE